MTNKETVITCPRCNGAVHTASILSEHASPEKIDHHLILTCKRCNKQIQFSVSLVEAAVEVSQVAL